MRVQPSQQVERAGVSWVEHLVTEQLGWLFREQETSDVGIDAQLEVVDRATAEATGRLLGVQIKSGLSYFKAVADDGWWFPCDADHISYWLGHSLPVLVMLYAPDTKRVYWAHVTESAVVRTGKGAKILVPNSQELVAESVLALRPLARSASDVPALDGWLTSRVEQPGQDAFFTHLLSARLYAMLPGLAIEHHRIDEFPEITIHFWDRSSSAFGDKRVDLAVVRSAQQAERLATKWGSPRRFVSLVIVIMNGPQPEILPRLGVYPHAPSVVVTPWSADGKCDAYLQTAIDQALTWGEPETH